VEDGTVVGGFGSAIAEFMSTHHYKNDLRILGIPDRVVEHGTPKELHRECGYDAQAIAGVVREMMDEKSNDEGRGTRDEDKYEVRSTKYE
jgi:1-deoxy-D-xylulose-5-phosphate synthase